MPVKFNYCQYWIFIPENMEQIYPDAFNISISHWSELIKYRGEFCWKLNENKNTRCLQKISIMLNGKQMVEIFPQRVMKVQWNTLLAACITVERYLLRHTVFRFIKYAFRFSNLSTFVLKLVKKKQMKLLVLFYLLYRRELVLIVSDSSSILK